jgi:murein DD-endopeptidase MepM/ murein hydrolase activator NlpD
VLKRNFSIIAHTILPRDPKRRLAIAATAAGWMIAVAATGTVQEPGPVVASRTVIEALALAAVPLQEADAAPVFVREERLERGDTIAALLARMGVDPADASQIAAEHGKSKALRQLRPGIVVQAQTDDDGSLLNLRFVSGRDTMLGFERSGEKFVPVEQTAAMSRQVAMRAGQVRSSLFQAADDADLPDAVAVQIAEIFGGEIDFNRDLRRGDTFAVLYEMFHHEGRAVRPGRVLAVEFVNNRKVFRAVWYEDQDGGSYYAPDGASLRKAFLRSPLEFSRVTSGFAMRMHPIAQEWRFHKGVDYAAPTGTRVRATGDAVVDFAGRQNGYGNLVVLRHRGGVSTHYAHLSGFASGIQKGARVAQGDTIGFVGATGWATGPHLHYEFRVNDTHLNPLTVVMPSAEPIAPQHLGAFRAATQPHVARLALIQNVSLAALE